jgi:callose synthase
MSGNFLLIYICNFDVLNHFLFIYICKLHWNLKVHDYILGHALFTVMYLLSIIQLGVLQTWLLYHNALSSGVAIEDILKYASRKKEGAEHDGESVVELRR